MALKGRDWFFGKCLIEERKITKFAYLSADVLRLGLLGTEHTQGHISQACGATQMFLSRFPNHKSTISRQSSVDPYRLEGDVLRDWVSFLSGKSGSYGQKRFCYSWDHLKNCLTRQYGGRCSGGGGGDHEFKIVLRLMVKFI
jgi:hypothetical protein